VNVLQRVPTLAEFRKMVVDGRVKAVIPVPAGALLDGLDALNDLADESIIPEGLLDSLSDIGYRVVGHDPGQYDENYVKGLLYIEVDAAIDLPEEGDDVGP
jgi:hypothetical protein